MKHVTPEKWSRYSLNLGREKSTKSITAFENLRKNVRFIAAPSSLKMVSVGARNNHKLQ